MFCATKAATFSGLLTSTTFNTISFFVVCSKYFTTRFFASPSLPITKPGLAVWIVIVTCSFPRTLILSISICATPALLYSFSRYVRILLSSLTSVATSLLSAYHFESHPLITPILRPFGLVFLSHIFVLPP